MKILSLIGLLIKYGPLIEAIILALEQHKDAAAQAQAVSQFERGFRVLSETNDPSMLQESIMAHCSAVDGCVLP